MYKLKAMPARKIIGKTISGDFGTHEFDEAIIRLWADSSQDDVPGLPILARDENTSFGVYLDGIKAVGEPVRYMVGVSVSADMELPASFEAVALPEGNYAAFQYRNKETVTLSVREAWQRSQTCELDFAQTPAFEQYIHNELGELVVAELVVPIKDDNI